jgi:hypothetical protein
MQIFCCVPLENYSRSDIIKAIGWLFGWFHYNNFSPCSYIHIAAPNSNAGGLWNVSLNLPSSYVSPSPSPDEMVIQQRGRRHVPATWSPDIEQNKQNRVSTRDRTPVKASPLKSTIVLRSTPRKRLLLNDPKELFPTPEKCRKVRIFRTEQTVDLTIHIKGVEENMKRTGTKKVHYHCA